MGIHINNMKTIHHITSALIATGSVGLALLTVSGSIPADLGFAALTVMGIAAFALFDYARPTKSLRPLAPVLRPVLPSESASPVVCCARRAA